MKKIVLRTYGKIIAWLLAIVGGMQACDIVEPRVEYGTPSVDYIISGKVTDNKTQEPIAGMGVIYKSRTSPHGNDTVKTDAEGSYQLNLQKVFPENEFSVYAEDLDGEANGGLFADDSVKIKTSEMNRVKKSNSNWYEGSFEKKNVNFELKQDSPTPMYGVPAATYKKRKE